MCVCVCLCVPYVHICVYLCVCDWVRVCLWLCMCEWVSECEYVHGCVFINAWAHTHLNCKKQLFRCWRIPSTMCNTLISAEIMKRPSIKVQNTATQRMPTDEDDNLESRCGATLSAENNTLRWHSACSGFPTCWLAPTWETSSLLNHSTVLLHASQPGANHLSTFLWCMSCVCVCSAQVCLPKARLWWEIRRLIHDV